MAGKQLIAGAMLMTCSALALATSASIIKWASHGFSTEVILAARFGVGLLILATLGRATFWPDLKACLRPTPLALQGLCYALAMFAFYLSIRYVSLVNAILLINTSPIWASIFSWLLFGKAERPLVWVGSALGMAGVAVVLLPGAGGFATMGLLALAAGALVGMQLAINSQLVGSQSTERIALAVQTHGMLIASLALLLMGAGPHDWQRMLFASPPWAEAWLDYPALVMAALVLGGLSVSNPMLTASSYRHGSVGQLSPFKFTAIIFAGLIDWLVWGEAPALLSIGGFLLIAAGGLCSLLGGRPPRHDPHLG